MIKSFVSFFWFIDIPCDFRVCYKGIENISFREHISAFRERERKSRQALISAKKNREVAVRYLKETMDRVRQRESEEEDKSRSDLNQRMSALLSLKRNIELNKVQNFYINFTINQMYAPRLNAEPEWA